MKIIRTISDMQEAVQTLRRDGKRIGFVPTMGYLHAGHLSLVHLARQQSDRVVVSIFVNPTQFGPNEDLEAYPRDFARDEALCRDADVDYIFYPSAAEMYPPGAGVYVNEDHLSTKLCGASRPGHFRGVLTVVTKLFHIVQPDVAVFGEKDAQQLRLIHQMVDDLNVPVTILPGPIVREADGLALSSRNVYLSETERREALCLRKALDQAEQMHASGERSARSVITAMEKILNTTPSARVDYLSIVHWNDLSPAEQLEGDILIALAVYIGRTRLIDNTRLKTTDAHAS
ncbi:MAG: pantoate--beta-alanine ligase [Kiritimatiellae bacterium]|nr:pantoate--beta-alanine ligase [Kiritimatiellia bacterium]MDD4735569.1 pantoate--beta-alanine ligase [Kiritimatiellia bacterium]